MAKGSIVGMRPNVDSRASRRSNTTTKATREPTPMAKDDFLDLYIDTTLGPAEAELSTSGVAVWAIIGHLKAVDWDESTTANDYGVSLEEVEAAVSYYKAHAQDIDARLAMNAA
jgi:hypothetical protein